MTLKYAVANISGYIKNSINQQPISGATISVWGQDFTSDSNGAFFVSNMPIGSWEVAFRKEGYVTQTINISFEQNITTSYDIMLKSLALVDIEDKINYLKINTVYNDNDDSMASDGCFISDIQIIISSNVDLRKGIAKLLFYTEVGDTYEPIGLEVKHNNEIKEKKYKLLSFNNLAVSVNNTSCYYAEIIIDNDIVSLSNKDDYVVYLKADGVKNYQLPNKLLVKCIVNDNIQTDLINVIPDKTSPKGVRAFPNYNPNWNKEQLKLMWFDKGISLQWNEVCNATSYNIYFSEEGDYFVKYLENISSTSAFISNFPSFYISDYPNKSVYSYCLQGGVKYYFKISANFEKTK